MAEKMLSSVRVHMPEAKVFQHSDMTTKEVGGVDGIVRLQTKNQLMMHRLECLAQEEECLSLDCDIVLMDCLAHIFYNRFDVALTKRDQEAFYGDEDLMKTQPYLGSVMASRCPKFWEDCVKECETMSETDRKWFGTQRAMKTVAARYKVHELPERIYSYAPRSFGDPLGDIKAVHYKGNLRKTWMLAA